MNNIYFTLVHLLLIGSIFEISEADLPCAARPVGESVVCVCNTTYCDTVSRVRPPRGGFVVYTSSAAGLRFEKSYGVLLTAETDPDCITSIELDPSMLHQKVTGFGGAVTDSACINWMSLPETARAFLTDSYFSERGIEYNMGRVPMGGTDFSVRSYAYNELPVGDVGLGNFTLADEDYYLKIPFIQAAMNVSTQPIYFLGSMWSPPRWMKDSNNFTTGYLKQEYYQTLADYFCKFLENYKENGIRFLGVTTTNEPSNGVLVPLSNLPRLQWTVPAMGQWIQNNLGPTIRNSSNSHVNIIVGDDQRNMIPYWFNSELLRRLIRKSISEAGPEQKTALNIVEDLNNNVVGWIDWNMCLNMTGGPTLIDNRVDSPIIVSADSEEFYKQPMYYALGHFSKFVKRGSQRLSVRTRGCRAPPPHVAFLTPENTLVLVVVNNGDEDHPVMLKVRDSQALLVAKAKSIFTVELPNE